MNPDKLSDYTDHLSDSVTLQWLDGHKLAFFSVNSSDHPDVKIWADKVEHVIANWREDSPYAVIHDVTKAFLSPYAQKRALRLLHLLQEKNLAGRYAVVVANTPFGQAIATFVNFTLRPKPGKPIMGKTFTTREAALAWIREQF